MPDQAGHDSRGGGHPYAFLHRPYAFLRQPWLFSPSSSHFFSVILAHARIQCLSLSLLILKETPWMPDQAGHDRRDKCRCPGASGRGYAPVPSIPYGGEDCLSAASSAAQVTGTGAQAPPLGGHARAPLVLGSFAETKEPRRAGPKPRNPPLVAWGRTPTGETQNPGCPIKPGMTAGGGGHPYAFLRQPRIFSLSSSTFLIEDPASFAFAVVLAPPGGAAPRSRPYHMGARTV